MQVNRIENNYPNFNGVARIRLSDNSTAVLNVTRNSKDQLEIAGDIMRKGKSIEKVNYPTEEFPRNSYFTKFIRQLADRSELLPEAIINEICRASHEKEDRYGRTEDDYSQIIKKIKNNPADTLSDD